MSNMKAFLKEAFIQINSGGIAGFLEVCIAHPLDVVKTRLQLQSGVNKNDPHYYRGTTDCLKKIYSNEGLRALWKGILPPIVAETPKRAVKFFSFEQFKQFFMFGSPTPTPLTYSLAGVAAGVTDGLFVNPFEVVKVDIQSNRSSAKVIPSTWDVTKKIVAENGIGLRGLNRGLSATILRNSTFNSIYFGFYFSVKENFPELKDQRMEFLRKAMLGFISGTLGCTANIPFDVVKSRMQGPQPVPGEVKYRSAALSLTIIYREEGFKAFYKGFLPKVLRLGPGGAFMLIIYENMHRFLTKQFSEV